MTLVRSMLCAFAVALFALGAPPARAQTANDVVPRCADADNPGVCEKDAASLRVNVDRAWSGDYDAQRIVAYCLQTTCSGAVREDRLLSCAWRIVIVHSGSANVSDSDRTNLNYACTHQLTNGERPVAINQAKKIFQEVYSKRLPLNPIPALG